MRALILIATVAGLVVAALMIGSVGVAPVLAAVRAIGGVGFVVLCLWSVPVLTVLGLAWAVVSGAARPSAAIFVWARTVREAATDVLPFSQLGGLVVGARVLSGRGIPDARVYASMTADLTTEMASQLVLTLAGVAVLAGVVSGIEDDGVLRLALSGLAVTALVMAAFALGQGRAIDFAAKVGERLLPASAASLRGMRAELGSIYRDRPALLWSFALNLLAWVASAAGASIALRFMGVEIPFWAVLTIESLIFAVRSVAFVIPGALGVQEGAYLLLAPLFGLDPQTALALSLIKRARDLAIGVPALLVWQIGEGRRLVT